MTDILHLSDDKPHVKRDVKQEFKDDIRIGLEKSNKQIYSKYFYDEHGSELFNQITRHPDYYLTRCEIEILSTHTKEIATYLQQAPFNLVELGPGEGIKTTILIHHFLNNALRFCYTPIDISARYLTLLSNRLNQQLPALNLTPIHADYFKGLEWLSEESDRRNLVLFLGSSIGNFDHNTTIDFLNHLREILHPGDLLLIGFDLRKDVDVLMRAYNDSGAITRQFNLNLLRRINRELSADFDLKKFRHYATYNVYTSAMESYLISLERQIVTLKELDLNIRFEAIEPIHVEYSFKYVLPQIEALGQLTGFDVLRHFTDKNNYFVDTLFQKK